MVTINDIYTHFLEFQLVSTDSRKITPHCVFFALKGDNFNGNLFALEAIKNGAAFAVVEEKIDTDDIRVLHVSSVLKCLQDFSNRYRKEFHIPIIAVTGSNGKTTTKELIASVLSTTFSTHFTKGNYNNHIGVPLTLLQLRDEHEIAIIEMGANHVKEIATLCEIAEPTHGIITNIGKAHLEGFGGIEGVVKGKGELFDYLEANNGVAFSNQSEISVLPLLSVRNVRQVNYSSNSKSEGFINVDILRNSNSLKLRLHFYNDTMRIVQTQLQGDYNILNVLNAVCIGLYFKIPINSIISAIESYCPQNNRSQLLERGTNKFILDAYNANPSSMELAITNFKTLKHAKKIAILGDMNELGEYTEEEHLRISKLALSAGFDKVVFVGKYFPKIDFKNVEGLRTWFDKQEWLDCYFLIKGSRGVALEKLLG